MNYRGALIIASVASLAVSVSVRADHWKAPQGFTKELGSLAPLAEEVRKGAVQVFPQVKVTDQIIAQMNQMRRSQGGPPLSPAEIAKMRAKGTAAVSSGSGAFISVDGYILTNDHVVDGADAGFEVITYDKRTLKAKLIGTDSRVDLAVLKVEEKAPHYYDFADSSKARVGEQVMAIGSPLEADGSVTVGYIGYIGRNTSEGAVSWVEYIQHGAPVNPGNSGGPLVDMTGSLLGINVQIISNTGGFVGISLAIPSNLAKEIAADIIKNGHVVRGYIGLAYQPMDPSLLKAWGLSEDQEGLPLITEIEPNGPAAKAGLSKGDAVLSVNGTPIKGSSDFAKVVASVKPGNSLEIEVRDQTKKTRKLTLVTTERPSDEKLQEKRAPRRMPPGAGPRGPMPGPEKGPQEGPQDGPMMPGPMGPGGEEPPAWNPWEQDNGEMPMGPSSPEGGELPQGPFNPGSAGEPAQPAKDL